MRFAFICILLIGGALGISIAQTMNSYKTERQINLQNPNNPNGKTLIAPNSNADSTFIITLPFHAPQVNQVLTVKSVNGNVIETAWAFPKPKYYVQTVSANNTIIADSINLILISGPYTFTLPTAVGKEGRLLTLKKTYNTVPQYTATCYGSEMIDYTYTYIMPSAQNYYGVIELISDGANWFVIEYKNSAP